VEHEALHPFVDVRWDGGAFQVTGTPAHAFGHRIPRKAGTPDGIHAAWQWDGATLHVEQDRYGLWPLFYFTAPRRICLSTSIRTLIELGARTDLDDAALAVFLRVGFFLGDDTALAAVRALPPGARVAWSDGRFSVTGARPGIAPRKLSRDEAMDAYVELFRNAMARRAGDGRRFVVPLSGGRDSRHIALALDEIAAPPEHFVTVRHYPPRNDADLTVAAHCARELGVRHVKLEQTADPIAAECEKNAHTSWCSDEHVQFLPLRRHLQGVPAVFDGIGGDVLSAGLFLRPRAVELCARGDLDGLVTFVLTGYDNEHVERGMAAILSRGGAGRFSAARARERVRQELETHLDAADPVSSFFFWNRTRREVALAPYGLLANVPAVFAPYLDHDVYDLLASLPFTLTADKRFHDDAIARAYPEFAHVPFAAGGSERHAPGFFRRLAWKAARYLRAQPTLDCFDYSYLFKCAAASFAQGTGSRLWFLPRVVCLTELEAISTTAPQ
jgi:hypothetical protein